MASSPSAVLERLKDRAGPSPARVAPCGSVTPRPKVAITADNSGGRRKSSLAAVGLSSRLSRGVGLMGSYAQQLTTWGERPAANTRQSRLSYDEDESSDDDGTIKETWNSTKLKWESTARGKWRSVLKRQRSRGRKPDPPTHAQSLADVSTAAGPSSTEIMKAPADLSDFNSAAMKERKPAAGGVAGRRGTYLGNVKLAALPKPGEPDVPSEVTWKPGEAKERILDDVRKEERAFIDKKIEQDRAERQRTARKPSAAAQKRIETWEIQQKDEPKGFIAKALGRVTKRFTVRMSTMRKSMKARKSAAKRAPQKKAPDNLLSPEAKKLQVLARSRTSAPPSAHSARPCACRRRSAWGRRWRASRRRRSTSRRP